MTLTNLKLADDLVERALTVATKAHTNQFRRNGTTQYIQHPVAVADLFDEPVLKAVALLHDVVENSDLTLDDLRQFFPAEIVNAVDALTKREGEAYKNYILRVGENPVSRKVKLADIFHNISDEPTRTAKAKYLNAFRLLVNNAI